MSGKFNTKTSINARLKNDPTATVNHEGEVAFTMDPLTDLYLRSASTLVGEKKFYESGARADENLIASINRAIKADPEFVLQLAVYCREKLHLRSVPLMLLAEFANSDAVGKVPNSRAYVSRTIQRADELTELVAYQLNRNRRAPRKTKLPMMLKYGIAGAFEKFDQYQFAKYNRDGEVKMRDALFLAHPKAATPERQLVYDRIASDTLPVPDTWEVMRSTGKMTWGQVVNDVFHKNGGNHNHMAQIRNLRNILTDPSVTADDVSLVCQMISDERTVTTHKQFPFRYLAAYREMQEVSHPMMGAVLDALETAAEYSLVNIPRLAGTTMIVGDTSASMDHTISDKSKITRMDIALVLAAIAHKFCDKSLTGIFGDTYENVSLAKYSTGLLGNTQRMTSLKGKVGYSTNGHKAIEYLEEKNIKVDRIMIFTDCQLWDSANNVRTLGQYTYDGDAKFGTAFLRYRQKNPGVKLYTFDLAGYGTMMLPQTVPGVAVIGGWSDRVFEFVQAFEETGKNVTIESIKAIRP